MTGGKQKKGKGAQKALTSMHSTSLSFYLLTFDNCVCTCSAGTLEAKTLLRSAVGLENERANRRGTISASVTVEEVAKTEDDLDNTLLNISIIYIYATVMIRKM